MAHRKLDTNSWVICYNKLGGRDKGDGKCVPGVKTHKITPSQQYTLKLSAAILGLYVLLIGGGE